MKKIEATIKPFKLDEVRSALNDLGVHGMTISEVEGCGRQNVAQGRNEYALDFCHKIKLEIVVADGLCDAASAAVAKAARTGEIGDGLVLISQVEQAIRIRTQESDQLAVC
jgi:nitrogen regulatory protein P-II 1